MSQTTPQIRQPRLSREERRLQLLAAATAMIEADGADALTLALLAEKAGVSKPVAYDHFETKTGLLQALLAASDSHYEGVARERLTAAPATLEQYSIIIAEAYIACAADAGPAAAILAAAMEASGEGKAAWLASRNTHVGQFVEAFTPVLKTDASASRLIFVGLVAAANALCSEMTSARITRGAAEETLTHLFTSTLSAFKA